MCLGDVGIVSGRWDEGGVPMASVAVGDHDVIACLMYEPDVADGEHVLVHTGFVLQRLGPAAARDALRLRQGDQRTAADPEPRRSS